MNRSIALGWVFAGMIVLGAATSAHGQVELVPWLEDASSADDRYGDYEPVSLESEGPLLLAQTDDLVEPPGQRSAQPAPRRVVPAPVAPVKPQPLPATSAPVVLEYASPQPYAGQFYAGQAYAPQPQRRCPPWRPCGPQESFGMNWLVMQGFAGADFRGACAKHDACLASGGRSRIACDQMFLAEMDQACNCSAFPILCRIKAREYYLGVRLFGWMF